MNLGFDDRSALLSLTRSTGKEIVNAADEADRLYDALEHETNGAEVARIRAELETLDRSVRVSIKELQRLFPG